MQLTTQVAAEILEVPRDNPSLWHWRVRADLKKKEPTLAANVSPTTPVLALDDFWGGRARLIVLSFRLSTFVCRLSTRAIIAIEMSPGKRL